MNLSSISRPALRYYGGKWRLAPWIIEQLPGHLAYVEPFGGAMSVLLRKPPSYHLRERPAELIRSIQLTPYSRAEQLLAFEPTEGVDELERARRLYTRTWQSHGGGRTQWRTGWRYEKTDHRNKRIILDWNETAHLDRIANRLKTVQLECDDALRIIRRYDAPDTLFYLDPPYLPYTRSIRWRKKAYTCEITEEYHRELGELLNKIQGMAILSGKPCDLYDELYPGWVRIQKTVPTDFQSRTVEMLWLSPAVVARQHQLRLGL